MTPSAMILELEPTLLLGWPGDGLATENIPLLISAWLLTYAAHSTLLLGGAWLVTRFVIKRTEPIREILWKTALTGGILTATLQILLSVDPFGGRISLTSAPLEEKNTPASILSGDPSHSPETLTYPEALPPPPHVGIGSGELEPRTSSNKRLATETARKEPLSLDSSESSIPLSTASNDLLDPNLEDSPSTPSEKKSQPATARRAASEQPLDWRRLTANACLAAGLLGLALFALTRLRLRRGLAERSAITDNRLQAALLRLRRAASYHRRVRLTTSSRIPIPMALGVLRPEICLPRQALTKLAPTEQDAVLAHELAHLTRRDPAWLLLCQVLECLFFFQPLNRLARRRLQESAEFACDAAAARNADDSINLARCLTEVAGWTIGAAPRTAFSSLTETTQDRSCLARRISRLLDHNGKGEKQVPRFWRLAVPAVVIGLFIAAAPGVTTEMSRNIQADGLGKTANNKSHEAALNSRDDGVSGNSSNAARERFDDVENKTLVTARDPGQASLNQDPTARAVSHEKYIALLTALADLDRETEELEAETAALREALLTLPDDATGGGLLDRLDSSISAVTRQRLAIEAAFPESRATNTNKSEPETNRSGRTSTTEPINAINQRKTRQPLEEEK